MLWKVLIPIVASALIGWGAWATINTTSNLPRSEHNEHIKEFNEHKEVDSEKFDRIQRRVEDKLDRIQELLIQRTD